MGRCFITGEGFLGRIFDVSKAGLVVLVCTLKGHAGVMNDIIEQFLLSSGLGRRRFSDLGIGRLVLNRNFTWTLERSQYGTCMCLFCSGGMWHDFSVFLAHTCLRQPLFAGYLVGNSFS